MRTFAAVVACGLLAAGCASMTNPTDIPSADPLPNVIVYEIAPPNASPVGPIKASVCDGSKEMVTRRLQEMTAAQGGNGLTNLVCRDEGISLHCWTNMACDAVALNVPPPPPPKPVPPPKRKKR